ncbi:hypothetical protein JHK84_028064 [Glycine max]|nr:hypothetical protein JHK86_027950 [Glycine max]KAG5151592.1 hypothetical protein JHK84_028064 [Glycine max]
MASGSGRSSALNSNSKMKEEEIGFVKILAKALSVFVTMEWVPPLDPKVKVNFVVAMIEDVGTGLEVIFSNSKGETMASEECRNMMQGIGSSLTLVAKNGNEVAQCLATMAYDYGERVWIEEVPNEASQCLQSDVVEIANQIAYE